MTAPPENDGAGRYGERVILHPAGDCANCGLPIHETHHLESIAREAGLGTDRVVTILVHDDGGHERCEGRDTVAERRTDG